MFMKYKLSHAIIGLAFFSAGSKFPADLLPTLLNLPSLLLQKYLLAEIVNYKADVNQAYPLQSQLDGRNGKLFMGKR